MKINIDHTEIRTTLYQIDQKIDKLNDRKIIAFFEFLGLDQRDDIPKDYLKWEEILIVVPARHISHELKKYKNNMSRIAFMTNPNAEKIHVFDFKEYKMATKNKTQFQIRQMLKNSFGGSKSQFGEN